jgi:hypothetical protein
MGRFLLKTIAHRSWEKSFTVEPVAVEVDEFTAFGDIRGFFKRKPRVDGATAGKLHFKRVSCEF